MDNLAAFWEKVKSLYWQAHDLLATPLFAIGESDISLLTILVLALSFALVVYISNRLKHLVEKWILSRSGYDTGVIQSIGTIIKYIVLVAGIFIIIQSTGINLSGLGFLASAFAVGIGFGLQNITNNFISGLIILFERPIKIGDRIEVGNIKGDVINIAPRSTTVQTNDNISVIVPNSEFISNTVVNWSHNDRMVRFRYPVGVSYKEDPRMVKKLLLEVAEANNGVLKRPSPDVWFIEFGDSSLNFELAVWTSEYTDRPVVLQSQLNYAISKKFRDNNIEIPYPQRDIHIRSEVAKEILLKANAPLEKQDKEEEGPAS